MFFVGITGGVGAGKSEILEYLRTNYNSRVMLSDEIAHELMKPGTDCYRRLRILFAGLDIYQYEGGPFDKRKLAQLLFQDPAKREQLNQVVHPAVRQYVLQVREQEREAEQTDLLVLESALLIENHYEEICDELWYIYSSEENRAARLKASRGYSDQKIRDIFRAQLTESVFRAYCKVEIDNNGTRQQSFSQIDRALALHHIQKIQKFSE